MSTATMTDTDTPEFDSTRLPRLLGLVYEQMKTGDWTALATLAEMTGASESSCSARLRDLRKPAFGGFTVERRKTLDGPFVYRLTEGAPKHDTQVEGVDTEGFAVTICADCWEIYPCPDSPTP